MLSIQLKIWHPIHFITLVSQSAISAFHWNHLHVSSSSQSSSIFSLIYIHSGNRISIELIHFPIISMFTISLNTIINMFLYCKLPSLPPNGSTVAGWTNFSREMILRFTPKKNTDVPSNGINGENSEFWLATRKSRWNRPGVAKVSLREPEVAPEPVFVTRERTSAITNFNFRPYVWKTIGFKVISRSAWMVQLFKSSLPRG